MMKLERKEQNIKEKTGVYGSIFALFGFLGCHQRPDRSFWIAGYQMPLCARCQGLILGYILGWVGTSFFRGSFLIGIIMVIPGIVDMGLQIFFKIESNNARRFLVGIFLGIGILIFIRNIFLI